MGVSSRVFFFFLLTSVLISTLLFQLSDSATLVVDGVSEWKNPTVYVGDSIIFKQKYNYKLYIFRTRGAFDLCNFTQAVLLTKPNSTSTSFTWHTSRPGFFYFSFNNGSAKPCQQGQKLAITVSKTPPESSAASPGPSPAVAPAAPAPDSGGIVSSSPAYPWPFQPHESMPPSPGPTAELPANSPSWPEKGEPFINSNPAVPLPNGEVDSATISPLPTSGHGGKVVVGSAVQMALWFVVLLLLP